MALQFIYGNSGSGKSEYVYKETIRRAAQNRKRQFYVVVPEQYTMETQKRLVALSPKGVILNIDVVSFNRLAYRIFDELGIHRVVMEETGKALILRKLAGEQEEKFTLLKGKLKRIGYVNEMKSMLSEMMQYGIGPEDLKHLTDELPEQSLLKAKLQDISLIYEGFLGYLSGDHVAAEQVLDVLINCAGDSSLLAGCEMIFDGFTGFTPVQMKLMRCLMKLTDQMRVTVTMDVREKLFRGEPKLQELFYMSRKMVQSLSRIAEEEHCELSDPVVIGSPDTGRLAGNPVLYHLEQNIFRPSGQPYSGECGDALELYSLANPKAELIYAGARISEYMRRGGYHYRDFAIITGNLETYGAYAKEVLDAYGVPCFLDHKKDILYHPFVEMLRGLLEILETDFSYQGMFRFLKTGFSGLSEAEVDELENYCIAKGIRGRAKWRKNFVKPMRSGNRKQDEEQIQQELSRINTQRQQVYEKLDPLYKAFHKKNATVDKMTRALYEYLTGLKAEEQLEQKALAFEASGDSVTASEYRQIYRYVIDLLDKMVELLGDEVLSIREYGDILEAGLSAARVGTIPPGRDCILIGDMERTRLDHIRHLFFVGVNDGIIPGNADVGGILSEFDRELLKDSYAVELATGAREQVFLQRFYLYLCMTKPSEGLHLSYARMDGEGKALKGSYLVRTLRKLFPALGEREIAENQPYEPVSHAAALECYVRGLRKAREDCPEPDWIALHQRLIAHPVYGREVEELLSLAFLTESEKHLEKEIARQLYGTMLYNSVTRLEQYARCAYAQFLKYGLGLQEREEFSFEAVDMGTMFHEILHRYSLLVDQKSDWYSVTEKQQEEFLDQAMSETVLKMPNEVLTESERQAYMLTRIRRIMEQSIRVITEQIRGGSFVPWGYEVEFQHDCQLDEDVKLRLTGIADRVDLMMTEDKIYIRITDYKSGKKDFSLSDLYNGRQLQLMLYLNSITEQLHERYPDKEIHPGGIFYFHLDDPLVEPDEDYEGSVEQDVLKEMKLAGLVSAEPEVYENMDHSLKAGNTSLLIPVKLKKDGNPASSGSSVASEEDFEALSVFTDDKIREMAGAIAAGDICRNPIKTGGTTDCGYCSFRGSCGFDLKVPGAGYREPDAMNKDEIWAEIRKAGENNP